MALLMFTRDLNQEELGFAGRYNTVKLALDAKCQFNGVIAYVIINAETRVVLSSSALALVGSVFP